MHSTMGSSDGLENSIAKNGDLAPREVFKIRSYQLEMLKESMKQNIIVAVRAALAVRNFRHGN